MSLRTLGFRALVILFSGLALTAAARDPWFPDGPVQPQIPHGVLLPQKVRTPQFPLKSARTLHSDAAIAQARANVAHSPAARAIADRVLADAGYWVEWSDEALRDLVTTAEVPRAVELCNAGCPVHGRKIYEGINGSSYPWIVDPKHPFKVTCPVGGETYPDNDYGAYYRSGFKDKASLDLPAGKIVDDGWGWVGPDGNRYWFVAHANHMVWQRLENDPHPTINSGILALSRAYVLTGEKRYAHKAAVLLYRVAAVYPTMNYEQQSRFGQLMGEQGTRYTGKIANLIWESYQVAPWLSEAYDNIWETLDADTALQQFYGCTGEQIRAHIEANYLEDAIEGYFAQKMRGNYGTHQRALLQLAVVRQHGDNRRYADEVLHRADGHLLNAGFDYALYNLVFRDGAPHESPAYNFVWVRILAASAELLQKLGYDLSTMPRMRRMFDLPLGNIALGRLTPALGDSGTVAAPVMGDDPIVYQRGLRLYGDPRYAAFLANLGATGENSFVNYDALFSPALPAASRAPGGRLVPPPASRLLSGYGYAYLNNPDDTRALGLYYGLHVAHYHHDRLHFDLFAHGRALTPDLGYPDGANEFNSSIFTWSKTSIAHNTVTVDAHRQPANPAGHLLLFADAPFARALSVDAAGTYPQTSTYRRTLVMVDVPDAAAPGATDRGYVVDFFDVAGGRQHDYSLHGPPAQFTTLASTWTAPAPGTLAGPDVAVGALYDDPERGAKDFKGSYLNYAGSGFQHLINVQRLTAGADTAIADYAHLDDPATHLRLRVLPQSGQELILADARVSPIKFPQLIKFLIARRTAAPGEPDLTSTFATVLEPYAADAAFISGAQRSDFATGTWVTVTRTDGGRDLILHHPANDTAVLARDDLPPIATDATVATITFDAHGQPLRAFFAGGTFLQLGERRLTAAPFIGTITSLDVTAGRIRVRPAAGAIVPDLATLPGRVLHLSNPLRDTPQTITSVHREGDELVLMLKDDLRVGLVRVASVSDATLTTNTALHLAAIYRGTTLCSRADVPLATITGVKDGVITLTAPPREPVAAGEDVWFVDGAIGETVRLPAMLSWTK